MVIKIDEDRAISIFNDPVIFDDLRVQADGHCMVVHLLQKHDVRAIARARELIEKTAYSNEGREPDFYLDVSLLTKIASELGTSRLAFWCREATEPILVRPYDSSINGFGIVMPMVARQPYYKDAIETAEEDV